MKNIRDLSTETDLSEIHFNICPQYIEINFVGQKCFLQKFWNELFQVLFEN